MTYKIYKIAVMAAAVLTMAASCSKDPDYPEPRPRPETAEQTVMMYLSGTDLISYFRDNIANAQKAVDNYILGDSRLLVFVQPVYSESLLLELRYDYDLHACAVDTLMNYGPICSTASENITKIMSDMSRIAPAKHYGLIMGSHATGLVLSTHRYLTGINADYHEYDDFWRKPDGRPHLTRWFGSDKAKMADINELRDGLLNTGIKFQYIIFDACFMSSVEALYDLRNTADYVAASPCEIMAYGLPYSTLLPYLFKGEKGESFDIFGACQNFYDFYSTTDETERSGCIAVAVCSELDGLAKEMKKVNVGKKKSYARSELQIYEGLSLHVFYDLGNYVEAICDDAALLGDFKAQFEKAFPSKGRLHTPSFYSDYDWDHHTVNYYSGVSVSEPSDKFIEDNRQTAWYRYTH